MISRARAELGLSKEMAGGNGAGIAATRNGDVENSVMLINAVVPSMNTSRNVIT
jgi:hypothetical protein